MHVFLWNILLAMTWALITGAVSVPNLMLGFVLGYVTLWLIRGNSSEYFRKLWQAVGFAFWFAAQIFISNFQVAYEVITLRRHARPGTIAIPLSAKTPVEITMLANLITLTPGTLSLDVSEDQKTLYIHAMFIHDPEQLRRDIKEGLEKRLLEVLR